MITRYDFEEEIEPGLKYTEDTSRSQPGRPVRDCCLWQTGVAEPVSDLNLESFRQRFGAVSVPAEGIGGVETLPAFRRRGLVGKLLLKVIAESAKRVPVVFVSNAIEELYERYGFVNLLDEAYLAVPVRNVERMVGGSTPASPPGIRAYSSNDLPALIALYNDAHAQRSWTHERPAEWNQLVATQTWQPGSEVIIFERDAQIAGYAILKEAQFGHGVSPFAVDELTARDTEAAEALLVEFAARCWRMRLNEFWVREPRDSVVGIAARRLGCTYNQTVPPSGGMMGAITDRRRLLVMLEPELRRRLPTAEFLAAHTSTFDALCRGEVILDNQVLLRLLVGHWSATDARALGTLIATQYQPICDAWFPGGGTPFLPLPYAHTLDRY